MARVNEVSSSTYGRIKITTTNDRQILYSLKDICKLFSINYQKVRLELPSNQVKEIEVIKDVRNGKSIFINTEALDTCLKLSEELKADEIYDWLISIKDKVEMIIHSYTIDDLKDDDVAFKVLKRLMELETTVSVLRTRVEDDIPKVEFANNLYGSKVLIDLNQINQKIKFKNMSLSIILEHLRNAGILDSNNQPFQKYIDTKHFRLITVITHVNEEEVKRSKVLVYKKGIRLVEETIKRTAGVKV